MALPASICCRPRVSGVPSSSAKCPEIFPPPMKSASLLGHPQHRSQQDPGTFRIPKKCPVPDRKCPSPKPQVSWTLSPASVGTRSACPLGVVGHVGEHKHTLLTNTQQATFLTVQRISQEALREQILPTVQTDILTQCVEFSSHRGDPSEEEEITSFQPHLAD
jgi:hypothetical protein